MALIGAPALVAVNLNWVLPALAVTAKLGTSIKELPEVLDAVAPASESTFDVTAVAEIVVTEFRTGLL